MAPWKSYSFQKQGAQVDLFTAQIIVTRSQSSSHVPLDQSQSPQVEAARGAEQVFQAATGAAGQGIPEL